MTPDGPPLPPEDAPTAVEEIAPVAAPPPPAPRGRPFWPWLLVLLALVLGGLALAWFLTRDHNRNADHNRNPGGGNTTRTATGAVVRVPSVVGMKAPVATARIEVVGLQAQSREVVSKRARGVVLAQNPQPGARLSRGGLVGLTVSAGGPVASVPAVVGLSAGDAVRVLSSVGLHAETKLALGGRAAGVVIAQKPGGGSRLKRGSTIVLTVSRGPKKVTVPDVVGLAKRVAVRRLRAVGLGASFFTVPSSRPEGVVVAQHPLAGETAPNGSKVLLNVSQGTASQPLPKARTAVPNVVGLTQDQATGRLRKAGFQVTVVERGTSDQTQDGIVLAQKPAAGSKAPAGSTVTITVGRFSG